MFFPLSNMQIFHLCPSACWSGLPESKPAAWTLPSAADQGSGCREPHFSHSSTTALRQDPPLPRCGRPDHGRAQAGSQREAAHTPLLQTPFSFLLVLTFTRDISSLHPTPTQHHPQHSKNDRSKRIHCLQFGPKMDMF